MNEINEIKKLMEAVDTPFNEVDRDSKLQQEFAKIIARAKAYYEEDEFDEDEVLENIDELFKGALGTVYGSQF